MSRKRKRHSSGRARNARRRLYRRDGRRCAFCGTAPGPSYQGGPGPLTVDHIVPLSAGGTNADTNLRLLCDPCHKRRHAEEPTP